MTSRITRTAAAAALGFALAIPGTAVAGDPPEKVADWQAHLAFMREMGPNFGQHIQECIDMHGSMAGLLGPNGAMTSMMAGHMGDDGQ
jgi:hypothetical protein